MRHGPCRAALQSRAASPGAALSAFSRAGPLRRSLRSLEAPRGAGALSGGILFNRREQVAEGLGSHRGQAAKIGHSGQEHRQVPDKAFLFKGLLHQRRRPEHGMEDVPVVHHREDGLLLQRLALVLGEPAAQLQDEPPGCRSCPGRLPCTCRTECTGSESLGLFHARRTRRSGWSRFRPCRPCRKRVRRSVGRPGKRSGTTPHRTHCNASRNLSSRAISVRWLSIRMMCKSLGEPFGVGAGPVIMVT